MRSQRGSKTLPHAWNVPRLNPRTDAAWFVRSLYIPGANIYLEGAVPARTVVRSHGAHLRKQATEDEQWPTAAVAPSALSAFTVDRIDALP